MKTLSKLSLLLLVLLIAMFAFPGAALAQAPNNGKDQVVFGGTYTLNAGQTLSGNLVVFGGLATLEKGSIVSGDVALTGGSLNVNGEINGDITSVGGSINLSDTAVVDGDINTVGGTLNRSGQAVVKGNISSSGPGSIRLPIDLNGLRNIPLLDIFHPIENILGGIFQSLAVAALALVVVLFIPIPTRRVSNAIIAQPVIAGGLGLLTVVVAPALLLLLAITILLIPLSLIGILLLAVAFLFGWIAVGMEVGERLAGLFKVVWASPVSAGIGTLAISLFSSLFTLTPVVNCIGWVLPVFISILGLGGVFLTRLGTRDGQPGGLVNYPPSVPRQPPVAPAPPPVMPPSEPPAAPDSLVPPAAPDDLIPPAD